MSNTDKEKLAEELKRARQKIAELEAVLVERVKSPPADYNTFKAFFKSATDSFSIWDSNLKMVYLNDATLTKYYPPGTKRADVIGKHFTELVPGSVESGRYDKYLNVLNSGAPVSIEEFTPHHRFGNMHLAIRVFKIENGLGVITIDLTERKRMEDDLREGQQRLKALIDSAPDIILSYDINGKILSGNKKAEEILGYAQEEMLGKNFAESGLFTAESLDKTVARLEAYKKGVPSEAAEYELIAKNGSHVFVEIRGVPLVRKDTIEIIAIARDISKRKRMEKELKDYRENLEAIVKERTADLCQTNKELEQEIAERKRAEQSLTLIRKAVQSTGDAIGISDPQGHHFYHNKAFANLFEYTPEELEAAGGGPAVFANKNIARKIFSAIMSGKSWNGEVEMISKSGRRFIALERADAIKDDDGKIVGLIGVQTDITERKRMEEELQRKERYFHALIEGTSEGIMVLNRGGTILYESQGCLRLLGYTAEERIGHKVFDPIHQDDMESVSAIFNQLASGLPARGELRARHKDGSWHIIEATLINLLDDPAVEGIVVNLRDVTERKRMEEDLRESEERLRVFFENVPDIFFAHNIEGQFTAMNKKALEISGYSRDEIIGKNILETGILPPDQIEGVIAGIKGIEDGKSGYPYEVQLVKKNGERITVDAVSFPVRRKGRLEVMGIAHDITERKKAAEALRTSEEKLRAIFEAIDDGIAVADLEGNLIDMNESDIRLFGYERREQLLNVNAFQFVAEADRPRVIRDLRAVLTAGSGRVDQYKLMDKNGNEFDAEVSGSVLRDSQGKPAAIVNIIRDITERKRMEEALKESEGKYRTLVEQSEQGICILQNGRIVFANKALTKMNGYTLKEVYAMSADELSRMIHPDDSKLYVDRIKMRLEGKKLRPRHEYRVIRKDGTVIWFQTFSKRILYRGQPAIQSMMANITDRKQWEDKLQRSKSDLSFYLSQINQAQEEERKRIARELHDDTIQEIVALSRQLDNLIDKKIGPEEERRENRRLIEGAQRKVDAILKGVRRFTRDLRPSILDDLGLLPALEWLTTDISEQFKIPIKISIRGEEQRISPDAALATFRIAQESLRNACRHSGATHIQVDLKYTSQKVTLSITDNGQGFELPEDTASLIRRGKLGVAGMYERAQLIEAKLSIKSKSNKGTAVTLEVNIK